MSGRSESCDFHWASLFTPLASLSPGSGVEGMTPFHGVQFFHLASFAMASSYPFRKPLHRLSPCHFVGLSIWTVSSSVSNKNSFPSYQNNQPIFLQEHIDFFSLPNSLSSSSEYTLTIVFILLLGSVSSFCFLFLLQVLPLLATSSK